MGRGLRLDLGKWIQGNDMSDKGADWMVDSAGNKAPPGGESKDSTTGKLMEKVGGVLGKEDLVEKGTAKREEKGAFE